MGFGRIWSDSVGFGPILIFGKVGQFGRTQSDLVGFGWRSPWEGTFFGPKPTEEISTLFYIGLLFLALAKKWNILNIKGTILSIVSFGDQYIDP